MEKRCVLSNTETLRDIIRQEMIEKQFNRKHIDAYIKEFLQNNHSSEIAEGIKLVNKYCSSTYYASKNARIAQLANLDISRLVLDIFIGIAYCIREELFTSVTAQLAGRLRFSDKADSIKTTAELVAVLCDTDLFDIIKSSKEASLMIKSNLILDDQLLEFINNSQYLPPMVCEPLELINNYSSGYLTHKDSLLLGKGNHHDGDLCLDVLNTMNKVPLRLCTKYLSSIEEEATFALDTANKQEQWTAFKKQSYSVYKLLALSGNKFYMTHKVDKRGRIYSQGYHVNPQGAAFKKAMCELADEELIEGVPK